MRKSHAFHSPLTDALSKPFTVIIRLGIGSEIGMWLISWYSVRGKMSDVAHLKESDLT